MTPTTLTSCSIAEDRGGALWERATRSMKERLGELAARAWEQHRRAGFAAHSYLVRPSIPILFFGDSERYQTSRARVLTVGLNPSHEEFPEKAPYARFPG